MQDRAYSIALQASASVQLHPSREAIPGKERRTHLVVILVPGKGHAGQASDGDDKQHQSCEREAHDCSSAPRGCMLCAAPVLVPALCSRG